MSDDALLRDLARLARDPLKFVLWAFPWGEKGTFLEDRTGPEPWQVEVLSYIRDGLSPLKALQMCVVSGRGVGKSAVVSWIILWAMSTAELTRGVLTANTETQLKTKTWVELNKWYHASLCRSLFKITATRLCSVDPEAEEEWRVDQVPWSEHRAVAFQGMHNFKRRMFFIFDEASGIADAIWDAAEGSMTDKDTEIFFLACGNPNENTGRFKQNCESGRWQVFQVDSRQVSFSNQEQIKEWAEAYGEDSDWFRVNVRGVFPRVGAVQFIGPDLCSGAATRETSGILSDALVMGVDVARFGDNESVLYFRRGRDARSILPIRLAGIDTMALATRVADETAARRVTQVFVDEGGVGGGVVDRLRQLRVNVIGVQFGAKSDRLGMQDDRSHYANKRSEMWGAMREWLKGGGIPNDKDLIAQLTAPQYGLNEKGELQLERKVDMRKRGAPSPDIADALALTFAYPVLPRRDLPGGRPVHKIDYDPFAEAMKIVA